MLDFGLDFSGLDGYNIIAVDDVKVACHPFNRNRINALFCPYGIYPTSGK